MSREFERDLPIDSDAADEKAFAERQAEIKKIRETEQDVTDEAAESEADRWLRENGFDPKKVD